MPPEGAEQVTSEPVPVIVSILNHEDEGDVIVLAGTIPSTTSRPRSPSSSSTKSSKSEEEIRMEKEQCNKRLLVSLGMLLPALAAIIGKSHRHQNFQLNCIVVVENLLQYFVETVNV